MAGQGSQVKEVAKISGRQSAVVVVLTGRFRLFDSESHCNILSNYNNILKVYYCHRSSQTDPQQRRPMKLAAENAVSNLKKDE